MQFNSINSIFKLIYYFFQKLLITYGMLKVRIGYGHIPQNFDIPIGLMSLFYKIIQIEQRPKALGVLS